MHIQVTFITLRTIVWTYTELVMWIMDLENPTQGTWLSIAARHITGAQNRHRRNGRVLHAEKTLMAFHRHHHIASTHYYGIHLSST